jgi:hypothetical protein
VIVLFLLELRDQLIEVIGGVREKLMESVLLALRIVASHQSHHLAEALGHGHEATRLDAAGLLQRPGWFTARRSARSLSSWIAGGLALGVAGLDSVLVAPPPGRPSQPVPCVVHRAGDQRAGQRGDFVAGQRDLTGRRRAGVLGGGGGGQERQGEHGQGSPPVPGVPAADLVLVQPCQALAGPEILLRGPT